MWEQRQLECPNLAILSAGRIVRRTADRLRAYTSEPRFGRLPSVTIMTAWVKYSQWRGQPPALQSNGHLRWHADKPISKYAPQRSVWTDRERQERPPGRPCPPITPYRVSFHASFAAANSFTQGLNLKCSESSKTIGLVIESHWTRQPMNR